MNCYFVLADSGFLVLYQRKIVIPSHYWFTWNLIPYSSMNVASILLLMSSDLGRDVRGEGY